MERICQICEKRFEATRASFCPECLPFVTSVKAEMKREQYAEAGLCVKCGKNMPMIGLKYCPSCSASNAVAQKRYLERRGASSKFVEIAETVERYRKCKYCPEPAEDGVKACVEHRRTNAAYLKELYYRRKADGLCTRCEAVLPENNISTIYCETCRVYKNRIEQKSRSKIKSKV